MLMPATPVWQMLATKANRWPSFGEQFLPSFIFGQYCICITDTCHFSRSAGAGLAVADVQQYWCLPLLIWQVLDTQWPTFGSTDACHFSCLAGARRPVANVQQYWCWQLLIWQVLDAQWEADVQEYGAINITGFRIVDTTNPFVQNFLRKWRVLDPKVYSGVGEYISVSRAPF